MAIPFDIYNFRCACGESLTGHRVINSSGATYCEFIPCQKCIADAENLGYILGYLNRKELELIEND